jgi:hypothetical protein
MTDNPRERLAAAQHLDSVDNEPFEQAIIGLDDATFNALMRVPGQIVMQTLMEEGDGNGRSLELDLGVANPAESLYERTQ